ncbi:MAG: flagellar protein FlgN [Planctomycetes bacterium]|nr:flagellar protein FlgN [Planctomycetota bacterium]
MTNSPPAIPGNVPALIALLEKQRALYDQLNAMGREQSQLIETAQTESLLSVLAQRQKLIDEVTTVNADLDPYRRRWSEIWADLNPADRRRVGDLVRAVESALATILKRDEEDRKALQSARAKVSEQIKAVSHAGAAVNAYRSAATPTTAKPAGVAQGNNRFMNRQG